MAEQDGSTEGPQFLQLEQRDAFRKMLLESLLAARRYNGSEKSFRELIEIIGSLDEWMRTAFGNGLALSADQEAKIASAAGAVPRSISDILDVASERLRMSLQGSQSIENILDHLHISHSKIDGVLVPPQKHEVPRGGVGGEWKEKQFEPRIQRLIQGLQRHGIYTDDLIVTTGVTLPNMMRKESYALIEIPRIHREVLVCNQVAEATFVCLRHLGLPAYLSADKEELERMEGVQRIICRDLDQWESDVIEALLQDNAPGSRVKVDTRDMLAVRQEILRRIPTGKMWVDMKIKDRKDFRINGRGSKALSSVFGLRLQHVTQSFYEHVLFGEAIYGSDDRAIYAAMQQELQWKALEEDPDRLKAAIKEKYPSSKEWMAMQSRERKSLKVAGRGGVAFASLFSIADDDPRGSRYGHALLGQMIYGSDDPDIRTAIQEELQWKEFEATPEKLRVKIIEIVPTGEAWINMNSSERSNFKIAGRGELAIAPLLGIEIGRGQLKRSLHVQLGQAIYGNEDPSIASARIEEQQWRKYVENPELLKAAIMERYPTGKEWMAMSAEEKDKLKIAGRKEAAFAGLFSLKLEENPVDHTYEHALLGQAIYGKDDLDISVAVEVESQWREYEKDSDKLRTLIKDMYPNGKEWLTMSQDQRYQYSVCGRGEIAIARLLSVTDVRHPQSSNDEHAMIGRAIYGDDDPDIVAAMRDRSLGREFAEDMNKLKLQVKDKCSTGKKWVDMGTRERKDFKIAGLGETAIARLLGVKISRNPCGCNLDHALLGQAIYGSNEPDIARFLQTELQWKEIEGNSEKLKDRIKEAHPTGKEWMAMTRAERKKFNILGRKSRGIARLLSVTLTKEPINKSIDHILLGSAIYGSDDPDIAEAISRGS